MHVVIVGGGIAGLGAAWRLREAGLRVTLLDANPDLGGRCRTFQWHGKWLIRGAAAFVGAERNLVEQARKLGIHTPQMVRDMTAEHSFDVPKKGKVHTLKQFAPTDILMSSLLPVGQKISLGRILPKLLRQRARKGSDDPISAAALDTVSACAYFREYAPDFVDYILEPVMSMFCGYSEDDYSLAWLVWLMASDKAWAKSWWTFAERGVGQLSQSLEAALRTDSGATILSDALVDEVRLSAGQQIVTYRREGAAAQVDADALIMAVPGSAVHGLIPTLDPARRAFFEQVRYVGHHILYAVLGPLPDPQATHLMLPKAEGYEVLSNITVTPDPRSGTTFVYGEIKGDACARLLGAPDPVIFEEAMAEAIRCRPDLEGIPVLDFYLQRNDVALCSRHVGYTKALKAFKELDPMDRVAFAGDYLINSSVGCAHLSGLEAAEQVIAQLQAPRRDVA